MSAVTAVQIVPRVVVEGSLRTARLPLTAIERVTGQQGNDQWPPALAYESFEAGIETVLGALLKDPALVDKGRLRQAKIAQLRKAAELGTLADAERNEAAAQLAQRQEQIADQREESERRAEQRKQELERQAEVRKQKVAEKAAKKAAAARRSKAAQEQAIDRHERVAKTAALNEESQALGTAKQALEAEETVGVIDATLDATKAARKSG